MNKLYYSLIVTTALLTTACTNDLENDTNAVVSGDKEAIAFVGQNNTTTRAGFAARTEIVMHIRSTKDANNIRETRTQAYAKIDETLSETSSSAIESPDDESVRYWDDAYGRDAKLSVFAVAIPGKTAVTNNEKYLSALLGGSTSWSAGTMSEEITWKVSPKQTTDLIADEDLAFSNNISEKGEGGVVSSNHPTEKDGYLKFRLTDENQADGPGKFDQGNLKFTHALSRITVNLVKGTGYGNSPFKFEDGTNVKILGVPTTGTLNIETGKWDSSDAAGITTMAPTTNNSGADYMLVAQILPGYTMTDGDNTNVLEFIIDDNKYFITQDMMLDALNAGQNTTETSLTMEKGKNYVFKITVGKSKIINVTATLEPWVNVTAKDQTMDNSHITLDLFTNTGGTASTNFDLYRLNDKSVTISTDASTATNWGGNYTDKATLTQNGTNWVTDWFFEDNKSFYHFRTVDKDRKIKGTTDTDNSVDDYFEITSGAQSSHDYHWGAPFKGSTTSPIVYSTSDGYTANLSPAIGATGDIINLTELHMMSNINVVLRTTKTSDAVALEKATNQCEVSLTYFYADGTVNMGNGLVKTTGSLATSALFTQPAAGTSADGTDYIKTNAFTFAVVPQALKRSSGDHLYVGITIKTPDNNQYYVVEKLADIIATANGSSQNQTENGKISFWYPNHTYTYTFTLTKAGIKNVTCTVQDWVNVTADNQNISLED